MNDYKDVIDAAIESGFTPDTCGLADRDYSWGLNNDFCGSLEEFKEAMRLGELSPGEVCTYDDLIYKWGLRLNLDGMCPEEALAAQIGDDCSSKIMNVITFKMEDNGEGVYVLTLNASYEPTVDVAVSFQMDDVQQDLTIPTGQKTLVTDLKGPDVNKPYATISLITITATDESYTYSSKNNVKNGKFTLTIINQGVKTTKSVKYGETVVLDTPSPKEGYTFIWRDKNGAPIDGNTFIMPESNTQVSGNYEVSTYVLHYVVTEEYFDNGVLKTRVYNENEVNVNYGQKIYPLLPSAQRTGYSKLQWAYGSTIITSATTMPAQNITAESIYSLSTYTLTFKVDNTVYESETFKYTEPVSYPSDPVKTGYNFLQWDKVIETMPAANTVVNAVFSAIDYFIRYYINGSIIDAYTETHHYGDRISIRPAEQREGYEFSGWNPSSIGPTMPAENIEVTATLVEVQYVLSLISDNKVLYRALYYYNEEVTIPDTPDSVIILYGSVPATGVTQFNDFASLNTLTYTGQSAEIGFIVPYSPDYDDAAENLDEDEWEEWLAEHMYDYYFAIPNSSVTSVTFENAAGIDITDTMILSGSTVTYDGVVYKIYYRQNQPQTNVDSNPSLITIKLGTTSSQGLPPEKEGYDFIGWNPEIPSRMPSHDVDCIAQFQIKQMTIIYKSEGQTYSSVTYNYGDTIAAITEPQKTGYSFVGWDQDIPAVATEGTLTVNAEFEINTYTITYIVDGVSSQTEYDYGEVIVPAPMPSKEGYTFTGWSIEEPATMPAENLVLTAQFEAIEYTLTYYYDDGTVYVTQTYNFGDEITALAGPEKTGYTFTGWAPSVPATMPNSNVSVTAQYSVSQWVLTYFDENGSVITAITYNYGAIIEPIASPSKEGYTFNGWIPALPQTMPDNDYDVTAQYTINTHTITWLVDGVAKYVDTYEYGENVISRPNETKTGYTFSGWDIEVPAVMDDRDYVVSGTFTINQYTLSFVLNGAQYTSITADYGTIVTAPVPYQEGYTFNGWTPQVPATMPAENMSFSGTSTVNQHTATYYIDGTLYTSITYNFGATIEYPNIPKPGYVLKWTKTYQTMPDTDITINGVYQEESDVVTIYYGSVIVGDVPTFNNYASLQPLDCTLGNETNITITIPLSPEYEEVEEEYSYDEFMEWVAEHRYHFYLLLPDDNTLTYTFKNAAGTIITEHVHLVDGTIVNMSGVDCKKYHKESDSQIDVDQTAVITITITKN